MDFLSLKKSVESVEMPDDMRRRILDRSKHILEQNMEEHSMKKTKIRMKRPVAVAAVLVLCLCLPIAGAALSNSGAFKDVTRWDGAVTGTVYENATNEIDIATVADDTLEVTVKLLVPDSAPYSACEELAIGDYQIMDAAGDVVVEGSNTNSAVVDNGRAVVYIPLDGIADGAYTLRIQSFVSMKKADQPLPITGFWECNFAK